MVSELVVRRAAIVMTGSLSSSLGLGLCLGSAMVTCPGGSCSGDYMVLGLVSGGLAVAGGLATLLGVGLVAFGVGRRADMRRVEFAGVLMRCGAWSVVIGLGSWILSLLITCPDGGCAIEYGSDSFVRGLVKGIVAAAGLILAILGVILAVLGMRLRSSGVDRFRKYGPPDRQPERSHADRSTRGDVTRRRLTPSPIAVVTI